MFSPISIFPKPFKKVIMGKAPKLTSIKQSEEHKFGTQRF